MDPDVLGRHFMAHVISTHEAEFRAGRGDALNTQEALVTLLSQYEDLSLTDVDPTNPEPEVAKVLSQHSDLQLVEKARGVLMLGLEGDHRFVNFLTSTYVPEHIRLGSTGRVPRELSRKKLTKEMAMEGMFGIDTGRMDCALCTRTVEIGTEVIELGCEHWFHPDCFKNWLRHCQKCPVCCQNVDWSTKSVVEKNQERRFFAEKKSATDKPEEIKYRIIE